MGTHRIHRCTYKTRRWRNRHRARRCRSTCKKRIRGGLHNPMRAVGRVVSQLPVEISVLN